MNISQWKIGEKTFFSLEVDDLLLLTSIHVMMYAECIEAQLQMVTPQPQHCSSQVQVQ